VQLGASPDAAGYVPPGLVSWHLVQTAYDPAVKPDLWVEPG
jgi:hypothetical protein